MKEACGVVESADFGWGDSRIYLIVKHCTYIQNSQRISKYMLNITRQVQRQINEENIYNK